MFGRKLKWISPAIALGALIAFSQVSTHADDASAPKPTGKIVGKVVDDKGEAVAGTRVRLMVPREGGKGDGSGNHKKGQKPDAQPQATDGDKNTDPADKPKDGNGASGDRKNNRNNKPAPVKEAKTDNEGTFTMTDVPVGEYVLSAGQRGGPMGRERVKVEEGKTVDITLTLQPPPPQGQHDGGGQKGQHDAPKPGDKN